MISVIIPCKNRKELLARAIKSCLVPIVSEIIVVDDGSADKLSSNEAKVILIRNQISQGAQRSRILGLKAACNNFCVFLDSDDELDPEFLIAGSVFIEDFPVVYGNTLRNNIIVKRFSGSSDYRKYLFKNLSLAPFSGLLVNKTYLDYELLSKDIKAWQDDDFIIAITKFNAPKYINKISNINHPTDDAISRSKKNQIDGLTKLLEKYKAEIILTNGWFHYYVCWRVRLLILQLEAKASTGSSSIAKALRLAVSPFFDQISS